MSVMAGFDFVLELSNAALLDLIKANLKIQGTPANPPFEVTVPISAGSVTGNGHIIVNKLLLDLNANDTVTLTLLFNNGSVIATSPMALTISALDGNIKITAPLRLASGTGANQRTLGVDLSTATVAVNFSQNAQSKITFALAGTPITLQMVNSLVVQALTTFVHNLGAVTFPLGFKVVSGKEGTLSPGLQFEKLEAHCIPNTSRAKQALGVFGILILANHAKGKHALKTATAIPAGRDVCISISPEAFHKKVLCPELAKKLLPAEYQKDPAAAIAKLPTTCGASGSISYQGVQVTSITSSFAQGHINLDGTVEKSGFCYEADGSFHGEITLTTDGTKLKPKLKVDEPDVDVSIPWYCWLAAAVISFAIGGVIGSIVGIIAVAIVDAIVNAVADSLFGSSALPGLKPAPLGGISGASFDTVSIAPAGLTVGGKVDVKLPTPATRSVAVKGSVVTVKSKVLSTGTFHNTFCVVGDFPYTEKSQSQVGTYQVIPTLMGRPLKLTWGISAGNVGPLGAPTVVSSRVTLTGTKGTVTIPKVASQFPFPLPDGTIVKQDVHIGYEISGNSVKLTNVPKEGNYYFWLHVRAEDPLGNVCEATKQGRFQGDAVAIGNDFDRKMADCLDRLNQKLKALSFQANERLTRYGFPPVNYPAPREMLAFVNSILSSEVPEADVILAYTRLVHGPSFFRAFASPEAMEEELGLAEVTLEFKVQ